MKKWYSYFLLIIGILGLIIFFERIIAFSGHEYFYLQNPGIEKYVGVNVVSRWADLSFFTYHTLIFFSVFCILQFIGNIFKIKKINDFIYRKDVLNFITTNYVITCFCYTLFELLSGNPTFGLYANVPHAWHSFGTNIIVHYVFFCFAIINFLVIKSNNKFSKKSYLYITLYLLIYFLVVKLTGMYCYRIIWYPYPIFDSESLCNMIGIEGINKVISIILLIVVDIVIYLLYLLVYKLITLIRKK